MKKQIILGCILTALVLFSCEEDNEKPVHVGKPAPTAQIYSVHPVSGPVGAEVVILGNNFISNTQGTLQYPFPGNQVSVHFGNYQAETISADMGVIKTRVPDGLTPGQYQIIVTINGITSNEVSFEVIDRRF